MTSFEQVVRGAKNPRDALIALARELDARWADLSKQTGDLWDSWGDGEDSTDVWTAGLGEQGPQNPYEPIPGVVDEKEVARLQELYDAANALLEKSYKGGDRGTLMRAKEEVDSLAAKLRLAKNPGSIIAVSGDMVGDPQNFYQVEGVDLTISPLQQPTELGNMVFNLPASSPEQKALRRRIAEEIDLPGFWPAVARQTPEAAQEIIENFVKGGPLWLYNGDEFGHDILMQMPMHAKQAMLQDVASYGDVRVAHEFARDIMRDDGTGIDPGDAQDYLLSVADNAINDGHMTRGSD